MKINFNYIKGLLVVCLLVVAYGFAEKRNNQRKLKKIEIRFTKSQNLYITEEAVNKLLIQNNVAVTSEGKETLDLNKVETALDKNPMIENAEVFLTLNGTLKTKISQRQPIGRVIGSPSFYVDRMGVKMPLSNYYSARVPIVEGVNQNNIKEVYPLLKYINNDLFLTQHITAIERSSAGYYELKLRQFGTRLSFGRAERIEQKFNNFKAFYKKAIKDTLMDTYKMVDLQFGNQVVCTKK